MQPNPLALDMPEAWYRINVWRSIDIAFSDTPYTYVVGSVKNKAGLASSERKNRYRTLSNTEPIQRKAIGKKGDAYVRTIGSTSTDWAASEAGYKWEDILIHLAGKIHFAEEKIRKLNVVGFAHAGAVLIRTNLDCPAGYTCRYTKGDPLEVYADANNFSKSLDVLIEIICGKLQILKTMEVINGGMDSQNNIARWKQRIKSESSDVSITIPDVHPSPKKWKMVQVPSSKKKKISSRSHPLNGSQKLVKPKDKSFLTSYNSFRRLWFRWRWVISRGSGWVINRGSGWVISRGSGWVISRGSGWVI
ncbi:9982_t:CDS:2, partial [Gigaspora rosea]